MGAEEVTGEAMSMTQYLWDTFDFFLPICVFLASFLLFAILVSSVRCGKLDLSPVAPAGSGFMLAYVSALGGNYSIWPSLVLISGALVFQGASFEGRSDMRNLLASYRWQVLSFFVLYAICTNYFLRAFKP